MKTITIVDILFMIVITLILSIMIISELNKFKGKEGCDKYEDWNAKNIPAKCIRYFTEPTT